LIGFGSLIMSIGGCNTIKEECNDEILVMQTIKEKDLEKKILKADTTFCHDSNGLVIFESELNYLYC